MLDGGVQGEMAMIGTSFADMVSKDNMIARSEPEETTQVDPEPIQPEEPSSFAEQVTDTKTTKPAAVKPLESVKDQTVAPTASEPVAKPVKSSPTMPPAQDETPAVEPRDEPQLKSSISQNNPQPDAATVETTPLQHADRAPKVSLSAVADMPTSFDAHSETALIPPVVNTITDAKNEVQKPALPETQTSTLRTLDQADKTPTTAQSSTTATSNKVSKPVDEKQMASVTPQLSQTAKAAPAAKPQPALETQQSTGAQIALLTPLAPTETAIASDVAQTANEGVPAPRARPPQPYDGKINASRPEPVVKKTAKKQTQGKTRKRQPAAKGTQSKTQRSAQNNSGKSTVTASLGGGKGSKTNAAGDAKASNYPGLVYRKIQRTRQKRVGGRGSVRVRFSISSNGRLAGISVARSSGSSKVDKAALAHIRRAAPFPAPPKGARRSFTIPVEIRR